MMLQWLRRLLARLKPVVQQPPPSPPQPLGKRERRKRSPDFLFRKVILDRLDDYFDVLHRMRKFDRESFDLFAEVGMHIRETSLDEQIETELSPWFLQTLPGFGAVGFGLGQDSLKMEVKNKCLVPKFIYFRKYTKRGAPPSVQRLAASGAIYVLTIYWDSNKIRHPTPTEFPVFITPTGEVIPLKTRQRVVHQVRTRKRTRDRRRGELFTIPEKQWQIDEFFREWAREHKMSAEQHMAFLFRMTAVSFEASQYAMVRVNVHKGDLTGVFSVDIKNTAYFFKDREATVNVNGQRKRIFHIVRPHERMRGNRVSNVHMHFRGEREFIWNDYAVRITIPGLHHWMLADFNVGMVDEEQIRPGTKTLGMKEVGGMLRQLVATGKLPLLEPTKPEGGGAMEPGR